MQSPQPALSFPLASGVCLKRACFSPSVMPAQTQSHWLRAQAPLILQTASLLMPLVLRAQCPVPLAAEEAKRGKKSGSEPSVSLPRPHRGMPCCNGEVVLPRARRLRGLRAQRVLASRATHHVAVGDMQVGSRTLQKVVEGSGSIAHCHVVASQRHQHRFHDGFALTGACAAVLPIGLAGHLSCLFALCHRPPCHTSQRTVPRGRREQRIHRHHLEWSFSPHRRHQKPFAQSRASGHGQA